MSRTLMVIVCVLMWLTVVYVFATQPVMPLQAQSPSEERERTRALNTIASELTQIRQILARQAREERQTRCEETP